MRFEYHPGVDALYIHLNPCRKPTGEGGDTVVSGDGFVVDIDADGVPSMTSPGWKPKAPSSA